MRRIIGLLACIFTVVVSANAGSATCEQHHCIAVVDAGSTGSRLHLFAYDLDTNNNPAKINEILSKKIKPGLATLEPNQATINAYLNNLFTNVQEENIPVYFYSTAGMRLLPDPKQRVFYQAIKQWFSTQAQWKLIDSKTITGTEEGVYGWLAVNYQLGTLNPTNDDNQKPLVSVMDMGGASVQVSFPVQNTEQIDSTDLVDLDVYGRHLQLFVHSFLGLGQTLLSEQYLNTKSCFANGYQLPSGLGAKGDATSCEQATTKLINNVHAVNRIIKPAIAKNPVNAWYTIGGLSSLVQSEPFSNQNSNFTIQSIREQADTDVCKQQWQDLNTKYPNHEYIYGYCLMPAYYYALLVEGYGIQPEQQINYFPADGQGADWSMGVVLHQQ